MKHISHLGYSPLQGLALVSGGYHGALMYPRLASLPSLEIIHPSTLPKRLGRSPVNTNHTVVFCVAGAFLTPVGAVNCLFMSEVGVSNQTKPPEHEPLPRWALKMKDSLSSCCSIPFTQSWTDLTEYEEQCCTICFPQQPFQFTELDTLLREYLQCGFHL